MPAVAATNITSFPVAMNDAETFGRRHPFALPHINHFRDIGATYDGRFIALRARDKELLDSKNELLVQKGRRERHYSKNGYPPVNDEKGNPLPPWTAEFDIQIAEIEVERKRIEKAMKECGRSSMDQITEWTHANRNGNFVELTMPKLSGDPLALIEDNEHAVSQFVGAISQIEMADRTIDEIHDTIRTNTARLKQRGMIDLSNMFAGGRLNAQGQFEPSNHDLALRLPTTVARVTVGGDDKKYSGFAEVENSVAIMFALVDRDGSLTQALLDQATDQASHKALPAIALADKPRLLRENRVQLLAAQRQLEAAYRFAEANNIMVRRVELPVEVLLWAERAAEPNFG